jgi:hypothetical protein
MSLLRLVSTGAVTTDVTALVNVAQKGVVNLIPDYVPAKPVAGTTDVGIKLLRSHYQQLDGNGALLGSAPLNQPVEHGGDMGGAIIPTTAGVTTENQVKLIQNSNSNSSNLGPVLRP